MSTITLTHTKSTPSKDKSGSSSSPSNVEPNVPLACFGAGRPSPKPEEPLCASQLKAVKQDVFIPGAALEEIMKKHKTLREPRWGPAGVQLGASVGLLTLSVYLLTVAPWFALPIVWAMAGLALSGLFTVGHDCAHGTWSSSPLANTLVGELAFLPLLQPFESFKLAHSHDKLETETPVVDLVKQNGPAPAKNTVGQSVTIEARSEDNTEPLPWWASHWLSFVAGGFFPKDVPADKAVRVHFSVTVCALATTCVCVRLWMMDGVLSLVKFMVVPLIAYHVLCPFVMRALTNNVKAFVPRSIAGQIPSYNWPALVRALSTHPVYGATVSDSSATGLLSRWLSRIHIINTFILIFVPCISLVGLFTTPVQRATVVWSVIYYFLTGFGITAGYHRLFAHKAFEAGFFTRAFLMLCGSGALEGSIKWWCGGHRTHHRYTDTTKDPYNAQGGFWYAHIGWMMIKPDPANFVKSDIRDLSSDPLIRWQHKYYLFVGPFMAFVFPTLVAGLCWGDWMGGYFYAGAARLFFVHHSTFCVNSVAHWFGEHTFDDERTPRDSIVTALLTLGEGYHNFHHEFPNDFRNGIQWYHYDPTKWFISTLAILGGAFNLKVFPANEVKRGVLYMREKKLAALKDQIVLPQEASNLPTWTWSQYESKAKEGTALVAMDGYVHDVTAFLPHHPGTEAMLKAFIGRDATQTFKGKTTPVIYQHSHAAHNLLSNMRVAVLDPTTIPDKKSS